MHPVLINTIGSLDVNHHTSYYCILGYSFILSSAKEKEAETVLYSTSVGIVIVENHRYNSLSDFVLIFIVLSHFEKSVFYSFPFWNVLLSALLLYLLRHRRQIGITIVILGEFV